MIVDRFVVKLAEQRKVSRFPWLWIGVSSAAFLLFVLTLSKNYSVASLEFVTEIEQGDWTMMLHRHKMLVHPMGWFFLKLWQTLGWQGKALLPLQVFNALAGAACAGLMYQTARLLTRSTVVSLISAAGFTCSFGLWLYSTEAEFVTLPLAEAMLILYFVLRASLEPHTDLRLPALLGAATAIAVLTFFTNLFLVPVALVGLWVVPELTRREQLRQTAAYLTAFTGLLVPVYLAVMIFVYGVNDLTSLQSWHLYGGQGAGVFYGTVEPANLIFGTYALLRTLLGYPGLGLNDSTANFLRQDPWGGPFLLFGYYLLILGISLSPLAWAMRIRKELWQKYRSVFLTMTPWVVLHALFAFYWVPKDLKFWLPELVPWCLLTSLLLVELPHQWGFKGFNEKNWGPFPPIWLATGTVVVFFIVNGAGNIFPHSNLQNNVNYQVAQSFAEHTRPNDLVITIDKNMYISYFGGRRTIYLLERMLEPGADEAQVFAQVDSEIQAARVQGGRIYLLGFQAGQDSYEQLMDKAGLSPQDFARYHTVTAWVERGVIISEILSE